MQETGSNPTAAPATQSDNQRISFSRTEKARQLGASLALQSLFVDEMT